jgi:hypothetical protein
LENWHLGTRGFEIRSVDITKGDFSIVQVEDRRQGVKPYEEALTSGISLNIGKPPISEDVDPLTIGIRGSERPDIVSAELTNSRVPSFEDRDICGSGTPERSWKSLRLFGPVRE